MAFNDLFIFLADLKTRALKPAERLLPVLLILSFAVSAYPSEPAIETGSMQNTPASARVGSVSLVLGKAYRYDVFGRRHRIERTSPVQVSDRIVTLSNGHVHLRFDDGAMVSVRPNSEFKVLRYDYDERRPEESAVKFSLEEGVTRAVSGDAARAARQRFRLNTPIAAIGVRGTDFVVSADAATTRALVNEGAIVLAPFSDACRMDDIGPCMTNALELTGNSLQMLTIDQYAPLPKILPAQQIRSQAEVGRAAQFAAGGQDEPPEATSAGLRVDSEPEQVTPDGVLLEGVTSPAVAVSAEVSVLAAAQGLIEVEPDRGELVSDFTPSVPFTLAQVGSRQLVWGRYADVPLQTDFLPLGFSIARAGREITVGNLDYGLFRVEEGPKRVAKGLGLVGFQLDSAQAVFNSASGVFAMQVTDGSLAIDFERNIFQTALELTHDLTGQIDFSAAGRIFDGGFFRDIQDDQRVAGAVSLDGSEAGYLFEQRLTDGSISGLTLWDGE